MSSKFNNQAAGVFWPPPVCRSKLAEQLQDPTIGMTAVAVISGTGIGFLGPWSVNATVRLKRTALHQEFQSGLVHDISGWWYQVLIEPLAGVQPYRLHLAFFQTDGPAPAVWRGDRIIGEFHPPTDLKINVTAWDFQAGSGVADARVWLH